MSVLETNEVVKKDIEAEVDQSLENPLESSTVQTSDTVAAANLNLWFFL